MAGKVYNINPIRLMLLLVGFLLDDYLLVKFGFVSQVAKFNEVSFETNSLVVLQTFI